MRWRDRWRFPPSRIRFTSRLHGGPPCQSSVSVLTWNSIFTFFFFFKKTNSTWANKLIGFYELYLSKGFLYGPKLGCIFLARSLKILPHFIDYNFRILILFHKVLLYIFSAPFNVSYSSYKCLSVNIKIY